jgi:predicted ArsR family transcriptional regulator
VDELAGELGVTDNAVRAQLVALERDGIVRPEGLRRGGGKPSTAYGLAPDFEPALSRAYVRLLLQLLRELGDRMPAAELRELMGAVGRRWAAEIPRAPGDLRARADAAAAFLTELGAIVEMQEDDGAIILRGASCPLGVVVRERPQLCGAFESLLSEVVGGRVRERCERTGDRARCCFEIARDDAAAPPGH